MGSIALLKSGRRSFSTRFESAMFKRGVTTKTQRRKERRFSLRLCVFVVTPLY
jgi:hypothetical protein